MKKISSLFIFLIFMSSCGYKNINLESELVKLINLKTNQQFNQFSNLYFNKVKKNIVINEY